MADLGTTTAPARHDQPDDHGRRRVTRRRTLPGGRAVVGALLITVAVVGVFAAWLTATAAPTTSWVVATAPVAPGQDLAPEHLGLVPLDLPPEQAARAFGSVDEVVDAVTLAALAPGDLLVRSLVRPPDAVPGTAEFSFALAASQALAGALDPGDRVDVVATEDGRTGFVATGVEVVASAEEGGTVVLTVALDDPDVVLAIAHAADEATLHVARSNADRPAPAGMREDALDPATAGATSAPTATADATSDDATPAGDATTSPDGGG